MRSVVARLGAGVAAAGLLVVVIGTFLPWLRSGAVLRNSFQSVGAVRILAPGGLVTGLLNAWLGVIPVCAVCVALYAVGVRRVSALIGCVVSLATGTVGAVLVVQGGDSGALVGVVTTGPAVTLVGAILALLGAVAVLTGPRGRRVRTVGGSP